MTPLKFHGVGVNSYDIMASFTTNGVQHSRPASIRSARGWRLLTDPYYTNRYRGRCVCAAAEKCAMADYVAGAQEPYDLLFSLAPDLDDPDCPFIDTVDAGGGRTFEDGLKGEL